MSKTHGRPCSVTGGDCYREDCDKDACCWSRRGLEAIYALTKGADLGNLSDYDDELASDVREVRSKAHEVMFGVPYSTTPSSVRVEEK
jgi:hypothetical protein